jgi:hypothetical protein
LPGALSGAVRAASAAALTGGGFADGGGTGVPLRRAAARAAAEALRSSLRSASLAGGVGVPSGTLLLVAGVPASTPAGTVEVAEGRGCTFNVPFEAGSVVWPCTQRGSARSNAAAAAAGRKVGEVAFMVAGE